MVGSDLVLWYVDTGARYHYGVDMAITRTRGWVGGIMLPLESGNAQTAPAGERSRGGSGRGPEEAHSLQAPRDLPPADIL